MAVGVHVVVVAATAGDTRPRGRSCDSVAFLGAHHRTVLSSALWTGPILLTAHGSPARTLRAPRGRSRARGRTASYTRVRWSGGVATSRARQARAADDFHGRWVATALARRTEATHWG